MIDYPSVPANSPLAKEFESMSLPGKDGISVRKVSEHESITVAIAEENDEFHIVRQTEYSHGKVAHNETVDRDTYVARSRLVDGRCRRDGVVASDTLDGVSYFVKCIEHNRVSHFVIINPLCISDSEFSGMAEMLDRFIYAQ